MENQTSPQQTQLTTQTETNLSSSIPENRNTTNKSNGFLVTLLSILLLMSVFIAGFFAWQTQNLVKELTNLQPSSNQQPTSTPLATNDPMVDWKTFNSENSSFSFKYPQDYKLSGMSIISPLNPNRNQKDATLQNGELKVEIVVEDFNGDMTVESCFKDHSDSGVITGKSSVKIFDTEYETIKWQGLGTGEFTCIQNNGKRYLINKYPTETTRQEEYKQILSTFKFNTLSASPKPSSVACTMEAKICPDGSSVGRSGPTCEFAPCPTAKPTN